MTGSSMRSLSMTALIVCGHGCSDVGDFETRQDEVREEIGSNALVCPPVNEGFPCAGNGYAGHLCIANALQSCTPAEVYSCDADSEAFWFVVPTDGSCELVDLSLDPGVVARKRRRFSERSCAAIEAVPQSNGQCPTFRLIDCD